MWKLSFYHSINLTNPKITLIIIKKIIKNENRKKIIKLKKKNKWLNKKRRRRSEATQSMTIILVEKGYPLLQPG
jgi:hypothetical protein